MTILGISPEWARQPAPPFQGWSFALPQFPGLTPWALLLDPFRVRIEIPI